MLIKNCPRCGKDGFLSRRWVRSSYRPKSFTDLFYILDDAKEALAKHPSETKLLSLIEDLTKILDNPDKWNFNRMQEYIMRHPSLRAYYGKYQHYYIGHYNAVRCKKEMYDYNKGKRTSRPNGRKWCKVPSSDYYLLEDALKSKGVVLSNSMKVIHKEKR